MSELAERLTDIDVRIDDYELHRREQETSSGFTRTTTVVELSGDGETGLGEDVTYDGDAHETLHAAGEVFPVAGEDTVEGVSERLAKIDLFVGTEPEQAIFRNYRRWAFESAALDLALKQAETTLAERLGREYEPVRFVVSTRLEEPPTGDLILEWLRRDPTLEFKLDPTSEWTTEVIDRVAETGAVRVLDLKGLYQGTEVDQPADPELYERVLEGFPDALIEDPALEEETQALLENHVDRLTWDYPIRGVETIETLPWKPTWLNIKPSRFGSVRSLFDSLEYCEENGIRMFGGGQFELDVGREQLHALASLFYPDAPNDIAPSGYNDESPLEDLPSSPLEVPSAPRGLEWSERKRTSN